MTAARVTPRLIRLAHDSPGRLRVRLSWLQGDAAAAAAIADRLAELDGVIEVAVRPRTGSLLLCYDDARTDAASVLAALRRQTAVTTVLPERAPLPLALSGPRPHGSSVARELARAMRELDADITEHSGGRLDLGTLAGLVLLTAGGAEVAVTRALPAPPWFSLAWWPFRTFTMFDHSDGHPNGARLSSIAPPPRERDAPAEAVRARATPQAMRA